MLKEFLKGHKVSYEERDVASDLKAREEMIRKSHQMGVPVVDIDGEIFVGFNRAEIARKLGIKWNPAPFHDFYVFYLYSEKFTKQHSVRWNNKQYKKETAGT